MESEAIHSKTKQIWKILSNGEFSPPGNPLVRNLEYELLSQHSFEPSVNELMNLNPNLLKAEPNKELRWQGHLLSPEILDQEHVLRTDPLTENMARFTQPENFSGILGPLLTENIEDSFQMNAEHDFQMKAEPALKKKSESD